MQVRAVKLELGDGAEGHAEVHCDVLAWWKSRGWIAHVSPQEESERILRGYEV
jgi:hypothetical protein